MDVDERATLSPRYQESLDETEWVDVNRSSEFGR